MNGHGGKRSRHVLPILGPVQVQEVRTMRAAGVPFKVIARTVPASRETLSRAANGSRTYQGARP